MAIYRELPLLMIINNNSVVNTVQRFSKFVIRP